MIELRTIDIENFLSIHKAKLDLANQGLILIEGENQDDTSAVSNGAGKSSIVDAISWVLYGITAKGVKSDGVVNIKAGKNCVVTLNFYVDGMEYYIQRHRKSSIKGNKVFLWMVDAIGTCHYLNLGTDKLTQQRIDRLMGCDAATFKASIYMGQESMIDLPNLTDKALKDVLQSAMNLDRLEAAYELAQSALAAARADLRACEDSQKEIGDSINIVDLKIAANEKHVDHLNKSWAQYGDAMDAGASKYQRDYDNLDEERALLLAKLPKIRMAQLKAKEESERLGAALLDATTARGTEIGKLQVFARDALRDYEDLLRKFDDLSRAQNDNQCLSCGRPFEHVKDFSVEMGDVAAKLRTAKEKSDQAIAAADAAGFSDAGYEELRSDHLEAHARMNNLQMEFQTMETNVTMLEERLESFEKNHMDQMDKLRTHRESYKKETQECQMLVEKLHATKRDMEADFVVYANDQIEIAHNVDTLANVVQALSRKGFRGEVFDQITPYLNIRTEHYLSQLTEDNITATWVTLAEDSFGNYIENFHIEVQHKSGVNQFAGLSGGEKRKVRLACALAMQDLVATRAIKPIKLFVADEIDDAIDTAGLELLMGLLEQKAREVGSVFIISHNPISDMVRNHITIVKKDGQSTIKMPTSPAL